MDEYSRDTPKVLLITLAVVTVVICSVVCGVGASHWLFYAPDVEVCKEACPGGIGVCEYDYIACATGEAGAPSQ